MLAVGLMSGTSMDGIDAALIETDGVDAVRRIAFSTEPYDEAFRARLRGAMSAALAMAAPAPDVEIDSVARELTERHAAAVTALLAAAGVAASAVDVVGFHGQTIAHRPDRRWTWQIGDGALLARLTGIEVVSDFRSADVAAGGHGAPLAPAYHRALVAGLGSEPVAVLNLGGVGNITWFGASGWGSFDTGPGNALIDDWVRAGNGSSHDAGGALASSGIVHEQVVDAMLDLDWFDLPGPKSLDRADFGLGTVRGLSLADGAATLTAFTAATVAQALRHVADRPAHLLVTGGGRHNPALMAMLATRTGLQVTPVEAVGWDGDALEAEAFGYLAVRVLNGLPTSWPETTGVPQPVTGGRIDRPAG
ncbi:anhydro-N-acetylmuramic acid kinase [Polymorphobacter megasporae]|uniref:anhydro-N-acetylmuramic acid kinase n=1 Tax=Glacieibacterium megasporae TaxID=2835787 RepID=UPI001C1E573A|nr:anhydro-N-acetylmuramic acid kinase [Polymorphobacter megasporae]UAJ08651.1 anhydro-N-acetylmuramic acid kinase [Polymorphobacter megasporae]